VRCYNQRVPQRQLVADDIAAYAASLGDARRYTDDLVAPFADDELVRQFSHLQSPLVWDLAHIAHYEELWLIREITGESGTDPRYDDLYDAFAHPRAERVALELLTPAEARAFRASVRRRVMARLERLSEAPDPRLAEDAFAVGLVVQHELQHAETMCQTLQAGGVAYPGAGGSDMSEAAAGGEVRVAGGPGSIGTSTEPWAYDNERDAHTVELAPFWIDVAPVTNAGFAAFVVDGGYRRRDCWSEDGWAWVGEEGASAPLGWRRAGDGFERRRLGRVEPVPPGEPVQHVSFFEAEAYAAWAGRRLPTEQEWEAAATWTPDGGKLRYPWGDAPLAGRANVGRTRFAPAPVGSFPRGMSPCGCHGMIGDVWEWTSSPFEPYPGFAPFPYPEYSAAFFGGGYRVLRGGSWATHPLVARATFRNWDHPERRQIFSGFRTARDA
jgi:iron(II)-dependent oxidoreductase